MTAKVGCCLFSLLRQERTVGSELCLQSTPRVCEGSQPECVAVSQQHSAVGASHIHEAASLPLIFGRFGCRWQFEDPARCPLGQLGSLCGDDQAEASLECFGGCGVWHSFAGGGRPRPTKGTTCGRVAAGDAEREPSQVSRGWQKYAAEAVHEDRRVALSHLCHSRHCQSISSVKDGFWGEPRLCV